MGGYVFVSYSHEDKYFVDDLVSGLEDQGVEIWYDKFIPKGANWNQAIDDATYDCAKFLVVLSPSAMSSPEVEGELLRALKLRNPILPVLYEDCHIPRRLLSIQYIDLREFDPDDEYVVELILDGLEDLPSAVSEWDELDEDEYLLEDDLEDEEDFLEDDLEDDEDDWEDDDLI